MSEQKFKVIHIVNSHFLCMCAKSNAMRGFFFVRLLDTSLILAADAKLAGVMKWPVSDACIARTWMERKKKND